MKQIRNSKKQIRNYSKPEIRKSKFETEAKPDIQF